MKKITPYFLTGLATGMLIGLIVSWLVFQHHSMREIPVESNQQSVTISDQRERPWEQQASTGQKEPAKAHIKNNDSTRGEQDSTNLTDSLALEVHAKDSISASEDSLRTYDNEFIVKTEQHIKTRKYPIIPTYISDTSNRPSANIDSLLIDDRHTRLEEPDSMLVEFWVSPINYTGFRRHRDRLQLFGISTEEPVEIVRKKDGLYMSVRGRTVFLKETSEHQPLQIGPAAHGY